MSERVTACPADSRVTVCGILEEHLMNVRMDLFVVRKPVDDGLIDLLYEMSETKLSVCETMKVGDIHISDWGLFKSEHPLIQKQQQELGRICAMLLGASVRIYESWYHIYRSGSAFKRHRHLNDNVPALRTFAFSYYLSRGDDNGSGQLRLFDPEIIINPEPGMMVLFPGSTHHEVLEYTGKTDRIMIGGNVEQLLPQTNAKENASQS